MESTNLNSKKSKSNKVLPAVIVIGAIILAIIMIKAGQTKAEQAESDVVVSVETQTIKPAQHTPQFEATGIVYAEEEVVVFPETSGKIIWVSPKLKPGGQVKKGEVLVRVDPRDAELAVQQQKSAIKAAEINLMQEEARNEMAAREWKLSGETGEANELASRRIQLESAKLQLEAAQSGLQLAELRLERTQIRAPFSASVASESVALGQVIGPSSQIGRLVGNQGLLLEVAVPVTVSQYLELKSAKHSGSVAKIRHQLPDGNIIEAQGFVLYRVGELDAKTRRVRLTIRIPASENASTSGSGLLPGAFVTATLISESSIWAYQIPRKNVLNASSIWTATPKNTLLKREINALWTTQNEIYAVADSTSLELVNSDLLAPVDGLKIKIVK
jgi:RND family efflux transporter MFP subunit